MCSSFVHLFLVFSPPVPCCISCYLCSFASDVEQLFLPFYNVTKIVGFIHCNVMYVCIDFPLSSFTWIFRLSLLNLFKDFFVTHWSLLFQNCIVSSTCFVNIFGLRLHLLLQTQSAHDHSCLQARILQRFNNIGLLGE